MTIEELYYQIRIELVVLVALWFVLSGLVYYAGQRGKKARSLHLRVRWNRVVYVLWFVHFVIDRLTWGGIFFMLYLYLRS